jgi:hypothetical protein
MSADQPRASVERRRVRSALYQHDANALDGR